MTKDQVVHHGRWLENAAFGIGVAMLAFAGFREAVASCAAHPFPWVTFIAAAVLVAPKMLGRATAGRIWGLVGGRVSKVGNTPDA